jgi:hypothetical protein
VAVVMTALARKTVSQTPNFRQCLSSRLPTKRSYCSKWRSNTRPA